MRIEGKVSGFTLIELSIVLVIIGLLIGGVVAGRSVLRQSEVTSLVTDGQKYIAAVGAFQQKYSSLPGDMANATTYWGAAGGTVGTNYTTDCYASGTATSPATCNGNGDGQIAKRSTYGNETLRVWQHLADAGFVQGAYTGTTGILYVFGVNAPAGKPSNSGFGLAYFGTMIADSNSFDGVYGHLLMIGGYSSTNQLPVAPTLTASEMQSIDTKYDDGKPASGTITTWKNGGYSSTCATTAVSSTAVYTTSSGTLCSFGMTTGF